MPISYSENARLTCPACGTGFEAEVWTLVDAAERPDLAQALLDGALDTVTCPHCGAPGPAGRPLVFHDPANRRVYFAAPPGVEQHVWREQAQSLLYLLVGSLAEEARLPYLGDVQVEQEVEGVRRAVLRRQRRRAAVPGSQGATETRRVSDQDLPDSPRHPAAPSPDHTVTPPSSLDVSSLVDLVRTLLAADSDQEFAAIVAQHPELLSDDADTAIDQLAEVAYGEGQRDVSMALHELRVALARMRTTGTLEISDSEEHAAPSPTSVAEAQDSGSLERSEGSNLQSPISDMAYQALLLASSPDELIAITRDYPVLLEEWADSALAARAEAVLDEGNERLARTLEGRREALADLRAHLSDQDTLLQAVRELIEADGEDAIAQVLTDYPILLTDIAQDALFGLAAGARAQGDQDLAEYTIECRALLRRVRVGLEE
jgi:CpXC motif protein